MLFRKNRIKVFISVKPKGKGGGSNSFASNFVNWLKRNSDKYRYVKKISDADKGIIIADKIDIPLLQRAKERGVYIIHRLDEYFEDNERGYRKEKHGRIIEINRYADITVFQSEFVLNNVNPYLKAKKYAVIINGADRRFFYPVDKPGGLIGHITWGVGKKKRLDILRDCIKRYRSEEFILIGNHNRSEIDFSKFKNVRLVGPVSRRRLVKYFHMMKALFFPSENDPCPNTAVEAVLSGVPVCYNPLGGVKEIVGGCGEPLDKFGDILKNSGIYRHRCFGRSDLDFDVVARRYLEL